MGIQTTDDLVTKRSAETGDDSRNGSRSKRPKTGVANYRECSEEDNEDEANMGERMDVLQPIRISSAGRNSIRGQKDVCSVRQKFRFKPGMKSILLDQVLMDNPEGCGHSSQGWDVPVNKLRQRGGEWSLFRVRLARETTRSMVAAERKKDETDREPVCNKIAELWKINIGKKQQRKKWGEAVQKTASPRAVASSSVEDLVAGGRDDVDEMETTTNDGITPSARKKVTDALECLKEAKEREVKQYEHELVLKKRTLDIEERKMLLLEEQAKVAWKLQEEQLEILRRNQKIQERYQERSQEIQAEQFQLLFSLLKKKKQSH